jgi:cyclopropane-fatty-acyl-phospholipid synthase
MRTGPIALQTASANAQHYEVPAPFFHLVLGPRLKYSCTLWESAAATLAEAETAMLRLTCARATVEDGMHVLDLGCGWGSLTRWLLETYPHCRVTAVSNSASQRAVLLADLQQRGLADRATVVTADMNVFAPTARFDRICSIEMFEHMRNYERLLERIAGWLTPDGRCFVHIFCHRDHAYPYEIDGRGDWMARHFFTGGLMPSFGVFDHFPSHLEVEQRWAVSGMHYAHTSRAWLENLDRRAPAVEELFRHTAGNAAARNLGRWRLFFLACEEFFRWRDGQEWFVGHYRLRRPASSRA